MTLKFAPSVKAIVGRLQDFQTPSLQENVVLLSVNTWYYRSQKIPEGEYAGPGVYF
jgi:hypothetical protein